MTGSSLGNKIDCNLTLSVQSPEMREIKVYCLLLIQYQTIFFISDTEKIEIEGKLKLSGFHRRLEVCSRPG